MESTPGTIPVPPARDDGMVAITVLVDGRALVRALAPAINDMIRSGLIRPSAAVESEYTNGQAPTVVGQGLGRLAA